MMYTYCSVGFTIVFFSGTGSSLAGLCFGALIQIKLSYINPRNPGLGIFTDDVPNCFCYTDYLLIIHVLALYVLVHQPVLVMMNNLIMNNLVQIWFLIVFKILLYRIRKFVIITNIWITEIWKSLLLFLVNIGFCFWIAMNNI